MDVHPAVWRRFLGGGPSRTCLVKIRTTWPLTTGPLSKISDAMLSTASRKSRNCACLAMLSVPFTPASTSMAASLIWHSTVTSLFSIVNLNARRSLSCPIIRSRVNGIGRPALNGKKKCEERARGADLLLMRQRVKSWPKPRPELEGPALTLMSGAGRPIPRPDHRRLIDLCDRGSVSTDRSTPPRPDRHARARPREGRQGGSIAKQQASGAGHSPRAARQSRWFPVWRSTRRRPSASSSSGDKTAKNSSLRCGDCLP